jgi:hypothetical protein
MNILIMGGGMCGLGAAMLLARDSHDVTVLERDADPVPDSPHDAWENWTRKGVAQFRQPHNLMPGLRMLLESDLPDVQEALRRAGAAKFDLVHPLPPVLADQSQRPIDDKLWTYTARRPVAEWVFATCAQREPRVTIRRGVQVTELLTAYRRFPAPRTSQACGRRAATCFAPTSWLMRRADSRRLLAGSPRLAAALPKKRTLTAASSITHGTSAGRSLHGGVRT